MLPLHQGARNLADPRKRSAVLQALDDAASIPANPQTLKEIEASCGNGDGTADVQTWLKPELARNPGRSEFETLMNRAALVRILVAFTKVETSDGVRDVRIDSMQ